MLLLQHFTFFDKIFLGSDKMTNLFENISDKNILKLIGFRSIMWLGISVC